MKKIIAILAALVMFASCEPKYDYETTLTYKVYYPENTTLKKYVQESTDTPTYHVGSGRGSNFLYFYAVDHGMGMTSVLVESTTAPIEVVSIETKKKGFEE